MSEAGNFDWVTARNECSISTVFEKLRLDVKADIETRQSLRAHHPGWGYEEDFSFASNGSKFSATAQIPKAGRHSVIFFLSGNRILLTDENDEALFDATVTLNNDRECMLVVGEEQMEGWQFRKRALEPLFFGEP
jgi:hypothetical protein